MGGSTQVQAGGNISFVKGEEPTKTDENELRGLNGCEKGETGRYDQDTLLMSEVV